MAGHGESLRSPGGLAGDVRDPDVVDLLTQHGSSVLDVAAVGVVAAEPDGLLRVAASSADPETLADFLALGAEEGPCLDSYHSGAPVVESDIGSTSARWPRFAALADRAGIGSVHVLPLQHGRDTLGAVGFFVADLGGLDDWSTRVGLAMAELTTAALVHQRSAQNQRVIVGQLQTALNSRVVIEQAKGALAQHGGLNADQAFVALRGYARHNRLKLTELAREIMDRKVPPAAIIPGSPRPATEQRKHPSE